jgi:hypothetical protein
VDSASSAQVASACRGDAQGAIGHHLLLKNDKSIYTSDSQTVRRKRWLGVPRIL